jgi:predicted ester cyclase
MNIKEQTVAEQNKQIIERMHEAMKARGLTAQLEFFAEQTLSHGFPTTKADVRAVLEDIESTFPDVNFETHEIVAEGDVVMVKYTGSGTHLGVQKLPFVHGGFLASIAPTGKKFSVQHIHVFRLKNGFIVQHDAVQDNLGMARQLGFDVRLTEK